MNDRHLLVAVMVIVLPTLVILIVQVAAFPLTLQTSKTINEVTPMLYMHDMYKHVVLQNDFSTEESYSECSGSHEFVFFALVYSDGVILALFSMIVAYETQKNLPKCGDFHKYHESAVINLTTISAILLSSICQAVIIILRLNKVRIGILLVITLRDCLWLYPMIYILFLPKVCIVL